MKKKVLIVEDTGDIAEALKIRLSAAGFEVEHAGDVQQSLECVARFAPDLILLDISIPGGGGFEVARHVRSTNDGRSTAIVFLTASKRPDLLTQAETFAPAAFLAKPFESSTLLACVRQALARGEEVARVQ